MRPLLARRKQPEPPKPVVPPPADRPNTPLSLETAAHVLELVAKGYTLSAIGRMQGMPSATSVRLWEKSHEGFAALLAEAREASAHALVDRAMDLQDSGLCALDAIDDEVDAAEEAHLIAVTAEVVDEQEVARLALVLDAAKNRRQRALDRHRVDTLARKHASDVCVKIASFRNRASYGDKKHVEHTGAGGGAIQMEHINAAAAGMDALFSQTLERHRLASKKSRATDAEFIRPDGP